MRKNVKLWALKKNESMRFINLQKKKALIIAPFLTLSIIRCGCVCDAQIENGSCQTQLNGPFEYQRICRAIRQIQVHEQINSMLT